MERVVVTNRDGSILARYGDPSSLRVEDILNDIKENDKKRGRLDFEDGARAVPSKLVRPGEIFVFVERAPEDTAWFIEHDRLPSPSTVATSLPLLNKHFGTEDPIYDIGRTSASATPLPLLVEAFGIYLKESRAHVLDETDWNFVQQMFSMSRFFNDEGGRQLAFSDVLEQYLVSALPQLNFRLSRSRRGQSEPDIQVLVETPTGECNLVALVEIKPEVGFAGEPLIEVMRYFADHVVKRRKIQHWAFLASCCPVLIIEVVGATLRVGGAAFLDKPSYEPFTPFHHIFGCLADQHHLGVVSRALGSIRVVIESLVDFYTRLQLESRGGPAVRDDSVNWPYLIRCKAEKAWIVQYERRLTSSTLLRMHVGRTKQLVFYMHYHDGPKRLVKFCQRYGDKVHLLWAQAGYAPSFNCRELAGNWRLIDMEYCSEENGWRPLLALDPRMFQMHNAAANKYRFRPQSIEWEKCKSDVKKAYVDVHNLHPSSVHGDLRRQNILYNVNDFQVAFVDFDWAGTHGEDRYPLSLNPHNRWAAGVTPCGVMRSEHDAELLDMELGS